MAEKHRHGEPLVDTSGDVVADRTEQFRALFPEAFIEGSRQQQHAVSRHG